MTFNAAGSTVKAKAMYFARWLAFLPAAVVGSQIVYALVKIVNMYTGSSYMESGTYTAPDSFLTKTYLETASSIACGISFVYIGVYVAPAHKRIVAYILAGLSLATMPVLMFVDFFVLPTQNYWRGYGWAVMLLTALVTTYVILHEGLLVYDEEK